MDPLTDLQVEAVHTIHHTILDQISEPIADTLATMTTTKTIKTTIGTTIETEVTSRIHDMIREIMDLRTGMTIIKIGTGLTTEDDQQNTNIIGTNPEHR